MNKKIDKIKAVNQLRKTSDILEKGFKEHASYLIQHEINLKNAKSQQAYDFAYKDYETYYEATREELERTEDLIKILESQQYLLSGILKKTAEKLLLKIKKSLEEQLAIHKIPREEVG
ncbi:hypothetical protein [Metasolibacillus sp.]|uniref:hypothetical protein n=1 Tax=Metasolibacillus sp. TaxID=2703680 RepID=UPI0025D711A2|nr:hypothetical protein [Metasolibacillus sp.]MCT6924104.1 hypothetical protein [Metasolibacillus sp.]MCT6940211.1 hypothetical protein [Metasolibacillus sp.]